MPRGKASKKGADIPSSSKRSTRSNRPEGDVVPDVYKELLIEATKSSAVNFDDEGRTIKRRRVGGRGVVQASASLKDLAEPEIENELPEAEPEPEVDFDGNVGIDDLFDGSGDEEQQQQMIYDDFMDSGDDDDEEFEDVDLEAPVAAQLTASQGDEKISLQPVKSEKSTTGPRRKPVSVAERKLRLDIHKAHVVCLLGHVRCRSDWSNDPQIQALLKPLLPRDTINMLHVDENKSQFQREHLWNTAIQECCNIWKERFAITAPGLRRAWWREDAEKGNSSLDDDADTLIDKDDFKKAARTLRGSRDLSAQLFCALLRSVAVDTRLVFSLQPLPFSGVAKGIAAEKPKPDYIHADTLQQHKRDDNGNKSSETDFSSPRRRLGYSQSSASPAPPRKVVHPKKQKIVDSPFPIFWVEVFNEPLHKWVPLDPIVRHTINKPKTGFEPPANDRLNSMSYVIAVEEDGSARDVTIRYARHFNAKTRKMRVESTKGGVPWWQKTMAFFAKPFNEIRDEIEDAELAAREAAEEMPRNVQDFKDHPRYALERHLRRNEAIWPLNEVGKISPGMGKDAKLESIYRRSDVHIVRSADQWYRKGRDVKIGEQPLKRVIPKRKRAQDLDEGDEPDEDLQDGTRLYAEFQTDVLVPPPIVRGRVPKNVYGNIDIYVPTMIPAGGIHIQHPEVVRAAKTLGIDYADAVTGFEFKGRQGTAVVKGIVVSTEYQEALVEVLRYFNDQKARALEQAKTLEALSLWKKFLTGLRIKERVMEYATEEADDTKEQEDDSQDRDYEDSGGGFFIEGDGAIAEPTAGPSNKSIEQTGGGFEVEDESLPSLPPRSTTAAASLEVESNWRLNDIDLDAGIIIQESPHTTQSKLDSVDPEDEIMSDEESSAKPVQSPPSRTALVQQYDLIIKPKPTSLAAIAEQDSSAVADPQSLPQNIPDQQPSLDIPLQDPKLSTETRPDEPVPGPVLEPVTEPVPSSPPEKHRSITPDSEIEKGSLLSEDPDDVDADPEWLED